MSTEHVHSSQKYKFKAMRDISQSLLIRKDEAIKLMNQLFLSSNKIKIKLIFNFTQ